MRRDDVIEARQARPFTQFRIHISDGGTFDIRHPEMLMVTRHSAIIGLPANGDPDRPADAYPVIDRHAVVDLLHITRIEQLDTSGRRQS